MPIKFLEYNNVVWQYEQYGNYGIADVKSTDNQSRNREILTNFGEGQACDNQTQLRDMHGLVIKQLNYFTFMLLGRHAGSIIWKKCIALYQA